MASGSLRTMDRMPLRSTSARVLVNGGPRPWRKTSESSVCIVTCWQMTNQSPKKRVCKLLFKNRKIIKRTPPGSIRSASSSTDLKSSSIPNLRLGPGVVPASIPGPMISITNISIPRLRPIIEEQGSIESFQLRPTFRKKAQSLTLIKTNDAKH